MVAGENGGANMVVVNPSVGVGCRESDGMNSFSCNIKGKVRKNLKLLGFEYPKIRARTGR